MEKHNIKIEVNFVPCPKCGKGHLLPFLKPHAKQDKLPSETYRYEAKDFSYYEVYYRCSKCPYILEGTK